MFVKNEFPNGGVKYMTKIKLEIIVPIAAIVIMIILLLVVGALRSSESVSAKEVILESQGWRDMKFTISGK